MYVQRASRFSLKGKEASCDLLGCEFWSGGGQEGINFGAVEGLFVLEHTKDGVKDFGHDEDQQAPVSVTSIPSSFPECSKVTSTLGPLSTERTLLPDLLLLISAICFPAIVTHPLSDDLWAGIQFPTWDR